MILRAALLAVLAGTVVGCSGDGLRENGHDPEAEAWVSIRGTRVEVELARTRAEQVRGLSDRRELAWGRGMLFQYSGATLQRFWMKRMHFAIDMVWIRDGRLVSVSQRVPPPASGVADSQLPTYGPQELVDSVLEVPAGFAEASGWRRGDRVELSHGAARR